MVTVSVCSKLKTSWKSVAFTKKVGKNSRYFVGVFNKTIILLALVGYEMIIAKSYPTRTGGIIVKYTTSRLLKWDQVSFWKTRKKLGEYRVSPLYLRHLFAVKHTLKVISGHILHEKTNVHYCYVPLTPKTTSNQEKKPVHHYTGAPNGGFLLNALKTPFGLSRVLSGPAEQFSKGLKIGLPGANS